MKATEFLIEGKTKKEVPASKPRNFVAKNAIQSGAGAHKDKKKAEKQGDTKHKNKELAVDEAVDENKVKQLEAAIAQLEQLMPAVMQLQKNHYEFQEIEDQINALTEPVSQLGDSSAITDLKDSMDEAIQLVRQANGAVYEIEKTLKGLLKSANYALDDAMDEEQYESRFGSDDHSMNEYSMDDVRRDAEISVKKNIDKQSDDRIAALRNPPKKKGFFQKVGDKQIGMVKGAFKGLTGK